MKDAETGMGRNWPKEGAAGASADANRALELGCTLELSLTEASLVGSHMPVDPVSSHRTPLGESITSAKGNSQ